MKTVLEKYRLELGLTYDQMAKAIGAASKTTPYHHCHGLRTITGDNAVKYSRALGIPLSELRPDLWPPERAQA